MRGKELLEKMELIDPAYVEAAEAKPRKKKGVWLKWGAMVACLCIVISAVIMIPYFGGGHGDPQQGEIVLKENNGKSNIRMEK